MRKMIRQIAAIYKRDIGRLFKNGVALIVTLGIIIIPSLYAWFNIGANFDPYSNTGGIKVAVANMDRGTENQMVGKLNAGDRIIDNLKKNDKLGWVFTDHDQAIAGVESGQYYAAIIIPEDFSIHLTEFLSGKIEKSEIDYYVNEKKNAIAPKITDTGAQTLEEEIRKTFTGVAADTVSKIVAASSDSISGKIDRTASEITDAVDQTRENLVAFQSLLSDVNTELGKGHDQINSAKASLEEIKTAAAAGQDSVKRSSDLLTACRQNINQLSDDLNRVMTDGGLIFGDISGTASSKLGDLEATILKINAEFETGIQEMENAAAKTDEMIEALKALNDKIQSQKLTELIGRLEEQRKEQQETLDALKQGNQAISGLITDLSEARKQIKETGSEGSLAFKELSQTLHQNVRPAMDGSLDSFASLAGKTEGILAGIIPASDQLSGILDDLNVAINDASAALSNSDRVLENFSQDLAGISTDLKTLKNSDVYKNFINLSGIRPEQVATFMASPVTLKTEAVYPVENYGSALAPFYTNLAIWVGGIVLIAIFKLEVDEDDCIKNLSPTAAYFGRWLLYVTIGLLQALVVCLGDIAIMKIQCDAPLAFVAFGLLTSVVYVSIIYALSLAFKHIGKAISVILVILQIPGSAGTYPIEMTPGFFQAIHPFLPFTYGINGMRECIAGIYPSHFAADIGTLVLFLPIAFLIGLGLRPALSGMNHFFDLKLSETELMLSETDGGSFGRKDHVTMVAGILARLSTKNEDTEERRAFFEEKYRKQIKGGFIAMFTLPVIFLILMFSVTSKMVFLILWILSIIGIATYLIVLEYFRDKMRRQLELEEEMKGMTSDEILEMIKGKGKGRSKR